MHVRCLYRNGECVVTAGHGDDTRAGRAICIGLCLKRKRIVGGKFDIRLLQEVPDATDRLVTIHHRHPKIHQDELRGPSFKLPDRFGPVARQPDLETHRS